MRAHEPVGSFAFKELVKNKKAAEKIPQIIVKQVVVRLAARMHALSRSRCGY